MRRLRPYIGGIKLEMLGMLQYTMWYWAHLFSLVVSSCVIFFLWRAILEGQKGEVFGFQSKASMIGYMVIITLITYSFNSNLIGKLANKVRQGTLVTELIRPVSFLLMQIAQEIGQQLMILLTQFFPVFAMIVWVFHIPIPTSFMQWCLFLISMSLGYGVLLAYSLLFSMFVFVTQNWWGLSQFSKFISAFFSGAVVPITMMPQFLQRVAYLMPFQSIYSVPSRVFVEQNDIRSVLPLFAVQVLWMLVLFSFTAVIWRKWIVHTIVVNGG